MSDTLLPPLAAPGAESSSDATPKKRKATGVPFEKGDPRINRKGRPPNFDALRALAKSISHEIVLEEGTGEPLLIEGHMVTRAEALLRQLSVSRNPKERQYFLELAFGKIPDRVELSGHDGGPLIYQMTWGDESDGA